MSLLRQAYEREKGCGIRLLYDMDPQLLRDHPEFQS